MENSTGNSTSVNNMDHEQSWKMDLPNLEENLLWKLHLSRKEAFQEMNSDVDEIVSQCLKAKRHLEALEDSNRNLKLDARSLRTKYEALLEKNRKDTGIIMRLKDSELMMKEALKNRDKAGEALWNAQMKNKEKTLERKLLEDDRQKLLFKSQTVTNVLRKLNLKHKRIHEKIEEENKLGQENESRLTSEIQELQSNLDEDDDILEDWLKDNALRDSAIRLLQDEMKNGSMVRIEAEDDLKDEGPSDVDTPSIETESDQSTAQETADDTETAEVGEIDLREIAFRQEWMKKKTLWEAAERQKEHWMDFYMLLNRRVQDLNIELINVREWRIDKAAEKKELVKSVAEMEKLVSQKRRKKAVPERSSIDEMNIWIKMKREGNEMLRKVIYRFLSIKIEDSAIYSEFSKNIRDMYLDTLKEQTSIQPKEEKQATEEDTVT